MPRGIKNAGEAKIRRCNEEEPVGSDERGTGLWVLLIGKRGEAEPEVGDRIKSEGLVVLGGGIVDAVEEKPGLVVVVGDGGGEERGRDDGVPEPADSGSADESGDWEEGENELNEVGAQVGNLCHLEMEEEIE